MTISYRNTSEHRLLMEAQLGRRLRKNEVVHHINGDGRDNRPENLKVMTRKAHARLHGKMRRGKSQPSDSIKTGIVMIRVTESMAEAVRAMAKAERRTVLDQLRLLVEIGLEWKAAEKDAEKKLEQEKSPEAEAE